MKQGKLVKITSRFVKETLFYLFNDVLIYGYEVMGSYIFKGEIPMGTTWVRDLPNTERTFIILVIRRCCRYCNTMPARALADLTRLRPYRPQLSGIRGRSWQRRRPTRCLLLTQTKKRVG